MIVAVLIVNICTILGALGSLNLKIGSNKLTIKSLINKNIVLGIVMYGLASVLFIPALKFGDLSVLYPMLALTYVWTVFFSVKFLKEKMNAYKWIGLVLIIIGVTIIGT
jgi:uncharacterized membrane protein